MNANPAMANSKGVTSFVDIFLAPPRDDRAAMNNARIEAIDNNTIVAKDDGCVTRHDTNKNASTPKTSKHQSGQLWRIMPGLVGIKPSGLSKRNASCGMPNFPPAKYFSITIASSG